MKSVFKPLLIAGLLATVGFTAYSRPMGGGECGGMMGGGMQGGMHHERMGKMDASKMQAMMDKRSAALKAQLKLTPAQEGAWTTFTAAMKPSAELMAKRPDPADMARLTTPERIDKMKSLHTQHVTDMTAEMDKRGEASKAFYATLTPEQQKIFDAQSMRGAQGGPRQGKGPVSAK